MGNSVSHLILVGETGTKLVNQVFLGHRKLRCSSGVWLFKSLTWCKKLPVGRLSVYLLKAIHTR